jgi:hypothetical protein
MKSRLSLKNSARTVLSFFVIASLICGCSSSTSPTYFKENIAKAIQDICRDEYKIEVKTKLAGRTLWIYLPIEDLLEKTDKPEKYSERFEITDNEAGFKNGSLQLKYSIKPIPEKEKLQQYKYNKAVFEKINKIWGVIRRIIFSMSHAREKEPQFFCLVTADIKNGLETRETFYYMDLKKVSYEYISRDEYQHRTVNETNISAEIIGDKEGLHLDYRDITLDDFVAAQIQHRIKLKFGKPEVDKNADIDKEILKIAVYTIKTYGLRDFTAAELNNLLTQNRIILNRAAVWARPTD